MNILILGIYTLQIKGIKKISYSLKIILFKLIINMADKLTKKDLQAKIDALEKELYLYKNKTQLARNYSIVKEENDSLKKQLTKKKEYWQKKVLAEAEEEEDEVEDEDSE
jgi:hypothetical protein